MLSQDHTNDGFVTVHPLVGTDPNYRGNTYFLLSPINVGRESVFDNMAQLHILKGTFDGKLAEIYSCPQADPCPGQLFSTYDVHFIDLPEGWDNGNEIDAVVGKDAAALGPVIDSILSSFALSS